MEEYFGTAGLLSGIAVIAAFILGIFLFNQTRFRRLMRSIAPGETVVATGLVSGSLIQATPAILLRSHPAHYRLLVADPRGSQTVQSVAPVLTSHPALLDPSGYVALRTLLGAIHFAPRRGLMTMPEQRQYANGVLASMLEAGLPTSATGNGA